MKDESTRFEFIELRAQNLSFEKISKQIGVSKPTLIKWEKEYLEAIEDIRAARLQSYTRIILMDQFSRIKRFAIRLEGVEKELDKRSLEDVKTEKLFDVSFKLLGAVERHGESFLRGHKMMKDDE